MSKITMDNLSDNLKAYMDSLGLSEDQVVELIKNNISGDLEGLNTSDKSSLVAAINELFQSANNGKELIATAIGEPLTSEDTFSAMSNGINGLNSQFKSALMNNGVSVNGTDKFKQLIEKLALLADSEGKGIQYATGYTGADYLCGESYTVTMNLDFIPTIIFVGPIYAGFRDYDYTEKAHGVYLSNIIPIYNSMTGSSYGQNINISNISENSFTITSVCASYDTYCELYDTTQWYAIGVGEEDTTLEDSLRDILGNKGVEVTEEDDLASLITKVDNIEAADEFSYNPQKTLTIPVQFYSTNPSNVIENNNLWYFSDVNNIVKSTIDSNYNITLQNTTTVTNMGKETLLTAYNNKLYTFLTNTLYIRNGDTYAIEKSVVCGANTTTIQVSNILKIILITTSDAVKIFDFNLNLITNIKVVANYATIYKKNKYLFIVPDSNKKQLDIYNFNGELIESKTMSNTINTPFIVKNMQTIIYSTTTSEHDGDTGFTNYYRRLNILDLPSGNSLVVSKDFGTGSRSSESFSPDKTITDIDKERFMTIYSYSYTDSFGSHVVRYCSIYDAKNLTRGSASSSSKGISSPAGGQINFICAPNDKTFIKMMTLYK